jgi:hypothetical protein
MAEDSSEDLHTPSSTMLVLVPIWVDCDSHQPTLLFAAAVAMVELRQLLRAIRAGIENSVYEGGAERSSTRVRGRIWMMRERRVG